MSVDLDWICHGLNHSTSFGWPFCIMFFFSNLFSEQCKIGKVCESCGLFNVLALKLSRYSIA